MVRKWEAMYYLRKIGGLSFVALIAAVPSLAFADTTLTSQAYVDMMDATKVNIDQGTGTNNENVGKALIVGNDGIVTLGDAGQTYSASDGVTLTGTNFTNSGVRSVATGSTDGTVSVNTNGTAAEVAVAGWANKVDVAQGSGNAGKGLVVNSSGNLALANILQSIANPTTSITNGATASNNDGYVVRSVVVNADGKTIDVTRDTVKIPVAAGAPSSNTPSDFAEVWVQ